MAFPHNQNLPAKPAEPPADSRVAGFIGRDFREPVAFVGLGPPPPLLAPVAMPETAVDQDDLSEAREDEVWASGQARMVKPEPVSKAVGKAPHGPFRACILSLDPRHDAASISRRDGIGH